MNDVNNFLYMQNIYGEMSATTSANFFEQLKEFLPKYISPMKSYIHAGIVFLVVFALVSMIINYADFEFDINNDGLESENEEKAKRYIGYGVSFLVAVVAADLGYTVSWKLRNSVNKDHLTYSRWFGSIYK